jgi:hypothetical protein
MQMFQGFFKGLNLPSPFLQIAERMTAPPKSTRTINDRRTQDVVTSPRFGVYDPHDVHFPDKTLPVLPGNGGYQPFGVALLPYDHQPAWNRLAVCQVGPLKEFLKEQQNDYRIKHV